MIKQLMERRAALKAELAAMLDTAATEARNLSEAEDAEFDAKVAEVRKIDARIAELQEAEAREAAAAKHVAETRGPAPLEGVTSEPNPEYRKGDPNSRSYFGDLFAAKVDGDVVARRALAHSQETRAGDLSTTANQGGPFAPPKWIVDEFVALARPGRITADLMNKQTLPSGVASINLPTVSGGASAAVQATQNTAVSDTAMTTGSVSSGITTIAGKQTVSLQLLKQSGIPFDAVILQDLARAYATALDVQVISGSGSSGQLRGLLNGASVGSTTYTTATPKVTDSTAANSFYNKLISAIASVQTNRFLPPTAVVMHPVRWGWVLEGLDSANRPLVVPNGPMFNGIGTAGDNAAQGLVGSILGLPVYVDPNIPQNLGAGTNEDRVFVLRQDDCWLYESDLEAASFDATYADQATVLFRVLGFSAFIPDRYGKSVNVISGTGLVTPTL